jgi:cell division protein FtsB
MRQQWLQHALRDRSWQVQRQALGLAALGVVIAIILGALYLAQSASVSTLGRQLEAMIAERNRLEQINEQLRAEIAQLRSVPRLLARAKEMGFVEAGRDNVEYLVVDGYNPDRVIRAVTPEPQSPLPSYDETFIGWLQQQFDSFTGQLRSYSSGG